MNTVSEQNSSFALRAGDMIRNSYDRLMRATSEGFAMIVFFIVFIVSMLLIVGALASVCYISWNTLGIAALLGAGQMAVFTAWLIGGLILLVAILVTPAERLTGRA